MGAADAWRRGPPHSDPEHHVHSFRPSGYDPLGLHEQGLAGASLHDTSLACSSLDGEVTESAMVPPPRKRVRFCPHDVVTFMNASSLAPQSLEEFLADVPSAHSPSLAACDKAYVSPATRTKVQMEAFTYVLENSKGLQKLANDSQPFLPTDEHQLVLARCSYLMGLCDKFLLRPDEFKDKFDVLAAIYSDIRYDFEVCFERVRTADQS